MSKKEIKLSIIIPTLNEANNLPLILSDLAEFGMCSEIIIIDSNSNDATKDIATLYGATYVNVSIRSRGYQLSMGANKAKGDWFLFIHADSRLNHKWSEEVNYLLSNDFNFIYFFRFKVNNKNCIFRFLELLVNLRTLFFKTPYGDQGLLIKRELYFKYGGYKNIPIMEDVEFLNRIRGKVSIFSLDSSILTSSRKWKKRNIFFQSIMNFNLRRKWLKGYPIDEIYKKYYDKNQI